MTRILVIVTAGSGQDSIRARRLTTGIEADITIIEVDRSASRRESAARIWKLLRSQPWDLVYQEGTGIVGGINLIRAARKWKLKYIVSSGDPIGGFFRTTRGPFAGWVGARYEAQLYRACAGFVGWTPYLTGLALRMGAPRAVTVEGAVDLELFRPHSPEERLDMRRRLAIPPDHLVCGVAGSLEWSRRQRYGYGFELIEALKRVTRQDLSVLIVGDGGGRRRLEALVPPALRSRAIFTGRVLPDAVPGLINAMDVGFVTQTLDGLGSFRLTTKLPEYLACGVPVAMSPVPGLYDYVLPAGWPLPPFHPASERFVAGCARWLDALPRTETANRAACARRVAETRFDDRAAQARFVRFVEDLLSVPLHLASGGVPAAKVPG
jgi:glycosyltransferase involved in cell wall biosynthesis